jgi:hypothetical protein
MILGNSRSQHIKSDVMVIMASKEDRAILSDDGMVKMLDP